jgi:hypothetical protein
MLNEVKHLMVVPKILHFVQDDKYNWFTHKPYHIPDCPSNDNRYCY